MTHEGMPEIAIGQNHIPTELERDERRICSALVREMGRAGTWEDIRQAANALSWVRLKAKLLNDEMLLHERATLTGRYGSDQPAATTAQEGK